MEDPNSFKIEELIKSFSASVISLAEDSETTLGLAAVVSATVTATACAVNDENETPAAVVQTTKNGCSVLGQLQGRGSFRNPLQAK